MSATSNTLTLALTLPSHAKIPKLIINKTLRIKKGDVYASSCPEYINFVPKNILAISGQKAKNNHQMLSANTEKYLYKIF
ncbi:MAG: hypothetical protein WCP92_09160 [bacterium]